MHFVDRKVFANAPIKTLANRNEKEQPKWLKHKKDGTKAPAGYWTKDAREKLMELFQFNCGYCGIYTEKGSDGEVDHYLPKSKDEKAEHIYDWNNYVWACHSCNSQKNNHYPLLNPCDKKDMKCIYFDTKTGQYQIYTYSDSSIIAKFELTVLHTKINRAKRPENRLRLYSNLDKQLNQLKAAIYELKVASLLGENEKEIQLKIKEEKKELEQTIKKEKNCGHFLLLIAFFIGEIPEKILTTLNLAS